MKIDNLLKYVWLACGGALLILFLIIGYVALDLDGAFRRSYDEGLAVNDSTKNSTPFKVDVSFDYPVKIGSTEFYLLPIRVSYDPNQTLRAGFDSYNESVNLYQPTNYLFLDKEFQVKRRLLEEKGLVKSVVYPVLSDDPNVSKQHEKMNYLLFECITRDSNQDGKLNIEDRSDLRITQLDGSNSKTIVSGWNILEYHFYEEYQLILIQYKENDEDPPHLARYHVPTDSMTTISSIDAEIIRQTKLLQK